MADKTPCNILLILTGGTICSFANSDGERAPDTERALTLIEDNFRKGDCPYRSTEQVVFHPYRALDILSENMTPDHWNTLIDYLKSQNFSMYDGIIILHGTDTLAYTASLFSMLLAGIKIPVFFVSAQLPVYMENSNGNANFKAAVELTFNGIAPNVYAVYRNSDNKIYVHTASRLLQCANYSQDFFSVGMAEISSENASFEGVNCQREMLLYSVGKLSSQVLYIQPYAGINYDFYCLDGVKAVFHGTYHSCTMASGDENSPLSALYLKKRCDKAGIPLFFHPCDKASYDYESTGKLIKSGARGLYGMSAETAYAKLIIGCSMGLTGDSLEGFVMTPLNGEMVY